MQSNLLTILLVDDEIEDLTLMEHALSGHGYRVITSMNAQNALQRFGQHSVDLLVTDISLPGRNGCALATELLSLSPALKVLFVSGHVGAEVCRFYGIFGFRPSLLAKAIFNR